MGNCIRKASGTQGNPTNTAMYVLSQERVALSSKSLFNFFVPKPDFKVKILPRSSLIVLLTDRFVGFVWRQLKFSSLM